MMFFLVLFGVGAHGLHHTFHAHETRALDEHAGRRRQGLQHGGIERLGIGKVPCAGKLRRALRGLLTQGVELLDALSARIGADLGMEARPLVAHLPHVTEHEQARAGQTGQHVDGRAHRVAIAATLVAGLVDLGPVSAKDFDPRVITFGDTREQIKSTPVTARPNRPLHVYGNTVRRRADRAARPTATQTR